MSKITLEIPCTSSAVAEKVKLVPAGPLVGVIERLVRSGPVKLVSFIVVVQAPSEHASPRGGVQVYPPSAHFMVVRPDEPYVPLQ